MLQSSLLIIILWQLQSISLETELYAILNNFSDSFFL